MSAFSGTSGWAAADTSSCGAAGPCTHCAVASIYAEL